MWKKIIFCGLFFAQIHAEISIVAFSGSNRKHSFNTQLLNEAVNIARQHQAKAIVVDLSEYELPFYNADLEKAKGMPANAKQLRNYMLQSQIIFIASPEYNGSLSALLKNALDWASRNENGGSSRDAFKDKLFVLLSASPGPGGGTRGLAHLKNIIENIGGTVYDQQFSLPNAYDAFDSEGNLKNSQQRARLKKIIENALDLPK